MSSLCSEGTVVVRTCTFSDAETHETLHMLVCLFSKKLLRLLVGTKQKCTCMSIHLTKQVIGFENIFGLRLFFPDIENEIVN